MRIPRELTGLVALAFGVALTWAQEPAKTASQGAAGKTVDLTKIERKILEEPIYLTGQPKYCLLVFGSEAKTRVWLVHDGDILYVDRNGNRELGEAGEWFVRKPLSTAFYVGAIVEQGGTTKHTSLIVSASPRNGDSLSILIAGKREQRSYFKFADRSIDAPIVHLNGPVTLSLSPPSAILSGEWRKTEVGLGPKNKLRRGWEVYLNGFLGTPGLNALALYRPSEVLPQPRLTIEVEFSEKGGGGRGLRASGFLAPKDPDDFVLAGAVRVPDKTHVGDVELTVTLPDNKEVRGVPLLIPNIWMRD